MINRKAVNEMKEIKAYVRYDMAQRVIDALVYVD